MSGSYPAIIYHTISISMNLSASFAAPHGFPLSTIDTLSHPTNAFGVFTRLQVEQVERSAVQLHSAICVHCSVKNLFLQQFTNMSGFSDISVWRQTTSSKFRQQAFIMFHGTDPDAASSIAREQRFRISTGPDTMLGNGVYVSASRAKAQAYGQVIFKLLVYPGDVCRVDRQGHPNQKTWQTCYDSAWVPRNCGMVPSGLEVIHLLSYVACSRLRVSMF